MTFPPAEKLFYWSVGWSRYLGGVLMAYFVSAREVDFVNATELKSHPVQGSSTKCHFHQLEVGGREILLTPARNHRSAYFLTFFFLFSAAVLLWRMVGRRLSGARHQLNLKEAQNIDYFNSFPAKVLFLSFQSPPAFLIIFTDLSGAWNILFYEYISVFRFILPFFINTWMLVIFIKKKTFQTKGWENCIFVKVEYVFHIYTVKL